jgi:predicted kinase
MKNILNVEITKKNQKLKIIRGIPGAGKSTLSKSLVLDGVIHSTDDIVEATGDYRGFFEKMKLSKDWKPLSRAHSLNLNNAIKSMKDGVSPVIIDNTNLTASICKSYVVPALEMGFDDKNIEICDIGLGGLDAKSLSERNTHGVPFDKIESMIQSYKSAGKLTIPKILAASDQYKKSDVSFSCVSLDAQSRTTLLEAIGWKIPANWTIISKHMTITLGPLKDKTHLGEEITLTVKKIGISDMALAVEVEGFQTKNDIPHITIAINPDGGKPVMSNDITKWEDVKSFMIKGIVSEIKHT